MLQQQRGRDRTENRLAVFTDPPEPMSYASMRLRWLIRDILIMSVVVILLVACRQAAVNNPASLSPPPANILLIGNSFTYFNDGVDQHLRGLAPASKVSRVTPGGYTLERHWNDTTTQQTLRQGGWGYVVLQEQSQLPVFDPARFRQFVTAFDRELKTIGAKTILFMTWERPDSVAQGVTTQNLANAYNNVGAELGAKVAPIGLAFAQALSEKPDLFLYSFDGHPSMYGTYLATCVLYGTIFERSPVGNAYSDPSISAELRTYLQTVAAKTLGYE